MCSQGVVHIQKRHCHQELFESCGCLTGPIFMTKTKKISFLNNKLQWFKDQIREIEELITEVENEE